MRASESWANIFISKLWEPVAFRGFLWNQWDMVAAEAGLVPTTGVLVVVQGGAVLRNVASVECGSSWRRQPGFPLSAPPPH